MNIQDLKIESADFGCCKPMADKHAADKGNAMPQLTISGAPAGTQELAIICHDPDAPMPRGFTHWTLYGIPADTTDLSAVLNACRSGANDAGQTGYFGPQPPAGHGTHHYYFWVYALDTQVEGEPDRDGFIAQYADHILEQNRLVGLYEN